MANYIREVMNPGWNTYGLHSVNTDTFNTRFHTNEAYPRPARNIVATVLRCHNLLLNILGYTQLGRISGLVRMGTGALMSGVTLAIGEANPPSGKGVIIEHFYFEGINTGIFQMTRGALEALVPKGWIVNAILDGIGTVPNLLKEAANASTCQGCMGYENHGPHEEVSYPHVFKVLYLV